MKHFAEVSFQIAMFSSKNKINFRKMVLGGSIFEAVIFQQGLVVMLCKEREFIVTCLSQAHEN